MIQVIPAIIPDSSKDIERDVARVKDFVSTVQVDILDGVFVPNVVSWPFGNKKKQEEFLTIVSEEKGLPYWQDVEYEVDMMVSRPERFVKYWMQAGASALIIHYSSTEQHSSILQNIRALEGKAGIAFIPSDFETKRSKIETLIEDFDFVQIMGSDHIGHHGVELDEGVYEIVGDIRKKFPEKTIAVDIGVNRDTAPKLVKAGVNKLVSGSAIFESESVEESISYFKSL